jgi:hypothetical protein
MNENIVIGKTVLFDNQQNHSTAFSSEERRQKHLVGLLPPAIETIERQVQRCMMQKIFDLGLARVKRPNDIAAWIEGLLYKPEYRSAPSFQRRENSVVQQPLHEEEHAETGTGRF